MTDAVRNRDWSVAPERERAERERAAREFLERTSDRDDPLADVESHGGYWGLEVPDGYHADDDQPELRADGVGEYEGRAEESVRTALRLLKAERTADAKEELRSYLRELYAGDRDE